MTAQAVGAPVRLNPGAVLQRTGATLAARWPALLILVLLLGYGPNLIEDWLRNVLFSFSIYSAVVVFGALSLIPYTGTVLMTAAATACAASPRQQTIGVMSSLRVALRSTLKLTPFWIVNALPVLVRMLALNGPQVVSLDPSRPSGFGGPMWAIASLFGFGLNLVLVLTVAVYVPVAVVERSGVITSIRRTLRLMRGGRVTIFILYLLTLVASTAFNFVESRAVAAVDPYIKGFDWSISAVELFGSVVQVCWAVALTVSYLELSTQRDGQPPSEVAEVFA